MRAVPLLFLSDSPYLPTGLARITKDLASLASQLPEFRVGVMGRGGIGTSKLPFPTYSFPETEQWGEGWLPSVWEDFAGSAFGHILTIWDLTRLDWFARPRMGGPLQEFLTSGKFKRWGYIPVDHYGIGGKLTGMCVDTLRGFDRILAYTMFGKQVIEDSLGMGEVNWIPHGINGQVFQPREKAPGRMILGVKEDEKLIGCVMTNQSRKDWGTAFGAIAALGPNKSWKYWFHTDTFMRYWNLLALIDDFGVKDRVIVTTENFTSEQLSYLYSACDITFLPSLGEGFGYPIVESLACGVPVVTGNFAGGVELIPEPDWLVIRYTERLDTQWNCVRPVWRPQEWAKKIEWAVTQYGDGSYRDICVNSVAHLDWQKLWPSTWKKWFLEGLQ